jgi:hypothetical protein
MATPNRKAVSRTAENKKIFQAMGHSNDRQGTLHLSSSAPEEGMRSDFVGLASATTQATRMKALREGLAALGNIHA